MGIVHAADGVRFVATASSREVLVGRLAAYVRSRCEEVLWNEAASEVVALLKRGDTRAAITHYFARIGERWDEERLELLSLEDGMSWTPDKEWLVHAGR